MKMGRIIVLLGLLVAVFGRTVAQDSLVTQTKTLLLMGTAFSFTACAADDSSAWAAIDAGIEEVNRIEKLISSWDPKSETSKINDNAGIAAVEVDKELIELIKRSQKISILTLGAFDISFASIDKVWKFDGSMNSVPSDEAIANSVRLIDFKNIVIDEVAGTVMLKEKGMRIGFGAIGKGYAANRASVVMKAMGIENGLVNASGDIIAWGDQADGSPWSISISDPHTRGGFIGAINIRETAVVTSGNYEKFVEIDGKRYSHIIDPRTGWPARGLSSVTIICPDAELADALATSVFVMGKDDGLSLVNQLDKVECILVADDGSKYYSNKFSALQKK